MHTKIGIKTYLKTEWTGFCPCRAYTHTLKLPSKRMSYSTDSVWNNNSNNNDSNNVPG